jgi:hypothetical protein
VVIVHVFAVGVHAREFDRELRLMLQRAMDEPTSMLNQLDILIMPWFLTLHRGLVLVQLELQEIDHPSVHVLAIVTLLHDLRQ